MKLHQAYELFKIDRESYCSSKTLIYYDENVPRFFRFLSEHEGIDYYNLESEVVKHELVQLYISYLRNSGIKNTSINTYFRAVKTFLNFCIEEALCDPDVLRKVKFLKSDQEPIIPLTEWEVDEIDGLYNEKTESGLRNLCIIHLMLDAGFRCSDVINLKANNISFSGNYLTVEGKGKKVRSVLLCPKLKKLLYRYLVYYRAYTEGKSYPVFAKVGKSDPITGDVIKQLFARIKKRTGIDRVHPHLLRHTFATSYIMGGGNMEFLRLMLGHADYDVTKRYLHLAQQSKMLQVEIYHLDPIFFKTVY